MAAAQQQPGPDEPAMSDEARKEWHSYLAAARRDLEEELYRQGREDGVHNRQHVRQAIVAYERSVAKRVQSAGTSTKRAWIAGSLFSSGALIAASSLQGVGGAVPSLGMAGAAVGLGMMLVGMVTSLIRRG